MQTKNGLLEFCLIVYVTKLNALIIKSSSNSKLSFGRILVVYILHNTGRIPWAQYSSITLCANSPGVLLAQWLELHGGITEFEALILPVPFLIFSCSFIHCQATHHTSFHKRLYSSLLHRPLCILQSTIFRSEQTF